MNAGNQELDDGVAEHYTNLVAQASDPFSV